MLTITPQTVELSVAAVVVTGLVTEGASRLLRAIARRAGARVVTVNGIRNALRIIWILISVAAVASLTQLATEFTVLTVTGIAGLVLSLSLQAVFSNIIAGFFLLHDRAVRVGDVIEFGGVKGRVARVALRNTWVVLDTGTVAIIGNSALMGGPLVNHSAAGRFVSDLDS
ncbi:MAG TPA: mechanosensitive ion channel domain-containing protein [Thermoplasmata archaeon]|nr:mechanosensitive ion channel domain-containing protein [Thermoplasmata archaeon]